MSDMPLDDLQLQVSRDMMNHVFCATFVCCVLLLLCFKCVLVEAHACTCVRVRVRVLSVDC